MLLFHVSPAAEVSITALLLLPFFLAGRRGPWVKGMQLMLVYAVMLAITMLLPSTSNTALSFIAMVAVGLRMMYPPLIAGSYMFVTTSISELTCALRKLRVPESAIVTFTVTMRFFPTAREDFRQIRSAISMRDVTSGPLGLLSHPARSLEYMLIPLLMNSTQVAQDLTMAALTKGITLPGRHTSLASIRLRALDWCYMAVCTVLLGMAAGGLW